MRQHLFRNLSIQLLTVKQGMQFAYYNPPIPSYIPSIITMGIDNFNPSFLSRRHSRSLGDSSAEGVALELANHKEWYTTINPSNSCISLDNVEDNALSVWWDSEDGRENPMKWSERKKWGTIAIVSVVTFVT
jgi:hypothetical protein